MSEGGTTGIYFDGNEREGEDSGEGTVQLTVGGGPFDYMSDEEGPEQTNYGFQQEPIRPSPPSPSPQRPHPGAIPSMDPTMQQEMARYYAYLQAQQQQQQRQQYHDSLTDRQRRQAQREMEAMRPYQQQQQPRDAYRQQQQQQHSQRPQYQRPRVYSDPRTSRWRAWATYLAGLVFIAATLYVYIYVPSPTEVLLPSTQFNVRARGYRLQHSLNLTEGEVETRLIADVQVSRILIDLSTHLRAKNDVGQPCLCMHHLEGFPAHVAPRRICALYNIPRKEVDYLINPRLIRWSMQGTDIRQRSLACSANPEKVTRPFDIWLEWDTMRYDETRPEGKRVLQAHGRFSQAEAACLMLALEEFEGKKRCKYGEPEHNTAAAAPEGVKADL